MSINPIWSIDMTQSGTITPGWIEAGSNSNEGVLHIPAKFELEPYHHIV